MSWVGNSLLYSGAAGGRLTLVQIYVSVCTGVGVCTQLSGAAGAHVTQSLGCAGWVWVSLSPSSAIPAGRGDKV